jgi:putative zinc finger protein
MKEEFDSLTRTTDPDALSCKSVRSVLWDFAAGTLDESDRLMVAAHLAACRECDLHRAEVRSVRAGLKSLPEKTVSPLLRTRLRVIASRERARQVLRRNLAARIADLRSRAKLVFDNLLRPVAVPAVGGMMASFLCFGAIVETLHVRPVWDNDIPFGVYTQVMIDDVSPFPLDGHDVMVQLTVDKDGKVSDFEVPQGAASPEQLRDIGNLVLFGSFVPATAFGQPVTGKILVTISHVSINIRG